MKIAVVGSGAREHAIIWKLNQSERVKEIFALPGNAGISQVAKCVCIGSEDIDSICQFAVENEIDMVVVGPEVPLAMGLVDELEKRDIRCFGVNKKSAQLEASKSFTKDFLIRHNIPTAKSKEYTDPKLLIDDIGIFGYPMVIKADGLAAGKGVVLAENYEEAKETIEFMMNQQGLGEAGKKILVEECLFGVEASCLCFVDENTILPMESAQDYKRVFDGDKGGNTGGMGTYSPSAMYSKSISDEVMNNILIPTLEGFKKDGIKFKGVLFVGLMITKDGVKVIEFNNRFGDPETQSVLMRMENDLYDIFDKVIDNRLDEVQLKWKEESAVCVVMASGGYPEKYETDKKITGLDKVDKDVQIFHAGTKFDPNKEIVTSGGRVLCVTALGKDIKEARDKAYQNIEKIKFENSHYRKDIALINPK